MSQVNPHYRKYPELTVNQMTWQVASLREVVDGVRMVQAARQARSCRAGRDLPGSNWHFYPPDPDGHINELYYGIEQIGWDGYSKPHAHVRHALRQAAGAAAPLRVRRGMQARREGSPECARACARRKRRGEATTSAASTGATVQDHAPSGRCGSSFATWTRWSRFYRDDLGLTVTEETAYRGHRCVFLRAIPSTTAWRSIRVALRGELELNPDTTLMSFGIQLGSYRQLHDAIAFLQANGVQRAPPAARALPRHRLLRLRHRSRRPRAPALLLHGADRLGRKAAPRASAGRRSTTPTGRRACRRKRCFQRRDLPGPGAKTKRVTEFPVHKRGAYAPLHVLQENCSDPFFYCFSILRAATTFFHFSISAAMKLRISSGLEARGSPPS